MTRKPKVLFVSPHNAHRSQIAAGYLLDLSEGVVEVRSAGPSPAARLNPVAVALMAEESIDLSGAVPARLTKEAVEDADVIITLGCPDAVALQPGKTYEDWSFSDPQGRDASSMRSMRDEIRRRVEGLLRDL